MEKNKIIIILLFSIIPIYVSALSVKIRVTEPTELAIFFDDQEQSVLTKYITPDRAFYLDNLYVGIHKIQWITVNKHCYEVELNMRQWHGNHILRFNKNEVIKERSGAQIERFYGIPVVKSPDN